MPLTGQPIRLNLQLWDGATNKFVRAFLFDDGGVQFASVNLSHVAEGLYSNASVLMPLTQQVKAVFRVFNDPLYSVESAFHSDSIEVFDLGSGSGGSGSGGGCELVGLIDGDPELIGYISQDCNIAGAPPC